MDVIACVSRAIADFGIARGASVTVAFSGGYDSLCLLSALHRLGYDVKALYVDHGLRSRTELDAERRLNESNCRLVGVPLVVAIIPEGEVDRLAVREGITLEAAARSLRYRILERETLVATAHNRDDQVETLMMKLIGGGTLMSLSGIRRRRGNVIRPLLDVPREDIVAYVGSLGLSASRDSTNDTLFCMRNRVRHLLMDSIREDTRCTLVSIADNLQSLEQRFPSLPLVRHAGYVGVDARTLLNAHPAARARTIYDIWSSFDGARLSAPMLERILSSISDGRGLSQRLFSMSVASGEVRFYNARVTFASPFVDGAPVAYGLHLGRSVDMKALRIDARRLEGGAFLRMDEEGDAITCHGRRVLVSSMLASWKCPYAVVLQDRGGVKAVFASAFGGRDRIDDSLRSPDWSGVDGWALM